MNDLNKIRKYVFIRCPDRTTGWWNSRISGLTGWKPGNYHGNWDHSMRISTSDVSTDEPSADGCLRPWLGQGKLSLSICWCWCVWFIECTGSPQTFYSMSWLCCLGRELNNYVTDRKPEVVMPVMTGFGICGLVYYITFGDGWSSWVINSSLFEAESVWQTWFTVVKIKRISLYRKILPDREEEILKRLLLKNLHWIVGLILWQISENFQNFSFTRKPKTFAIFEGKSQQWLLG